jgi:DNA-directed RNA polymerase subunit M
MKFCPKCKTILIPERIKGKSYLVCKKCGYKEESREKLLIISGVKEESREVVVIGESKENLPTIDIICPKCGNTKAYWYMQQTRSADEPPTVFYKCTKCGYSWRSYE